MYLTKDEDRVYDGEQGWAYQVAMRILVRLGDLFGAERLIPIETAHLSGVSYKTTGDAAIDFLQALVDSKGKVRVKSTTNPSGFDEKHIAEMEITRDRASRQKSLLELYRRLGADRTLTCTPYYIHKPGKNTHLAWAESSAVVYANSVLESYTNREGAPSALAAALIGKTPNCGLHKNENREPNFLINVETELEDAVDYGLLGFTLGEMLGEGIPYIKGLKKPPEVGLKHLGASMASSGMSSMFTYKKSCLEKNLERVTIDGETLKETLEKLSTSEEDIDLVFVGCPHCSKAELRTVARLLEDRKVKNGVRLWICTSRHVKKQEESSVRIIEAAGGIVLCDTCAVVTWLRDADIETLMTNSAKTAHYAPGFNKVEVKLASLWECVKMASEK